MGPTQTGRAHANWTILVPQIRIRQEKNSGSLYLQTSTCLPLSSTFCLSEGLPIVFGSCCFFFLVKLDPFCWWLSETWQVFPILSDYSISKPNLWPRRLSQPIRLTLSSITSVGLALFYYNHHWVLLIGLSRIVLLWAGLNYFYAFSINIHIVISTNQNTTYLNGPLPFQSPLILIKKKKNFVLINNSFERSSPL